MSRVDVSARVLHTVSMAPKDWKRLAGYVRERRDELGLTQEQVAAAGGPSTATLRLIETSAQSEYRAKSLRQLEDALRWRSGSVRAILAGGEPAEAGRSPADVRDPAEADLDLIRGLSPEDRATALRFAEFIASQRAAREDRRESSG